MSGDIGNAFERLRRLLPKIRYHRQIDASLAMAGSPELHLPLMHYVLLGYSKDVAKQIALAGYELMGKSDLQFISEAFRMLADIFQYHPSISAKQFLSRGFAERKLHMMADVILAVIERKKRLLPPVSSTSRRLSIHPASVVRTLKDASQPQELPSPRASPPPMPTAHVQDRLDENSVDLIAAVTDRLSSLETSVKTFFESLNARVTIIEGRIRFLEQKCNSPPLPDREEQERLNGHPSPIVEKTQRFDAVHDDPDSRHQSISVPITFSDRISGGSSDQSLQDAFATLSTTPDASFVSNLLARVQKTDQLLLSQQRTEVFADSSAATERPS
uniref:Centrosomal protein of 44 kDa n=1 Tax=Spongospora subterranea TaxID=70186 RepID=A0A0H5R6B4_9EUKA|eukprot:CRZ09688.1 hypothetical protein [Spongospora subterranea]